MVPEHHEDVDITRLPGCRCVDEQRGFEELKSESEVCAVMLQLQVGVHG